MVRPEQADRDYYRVLGVSPTSSAQEIRQAYLRRIAVVHPDHNADDSGIRPHAEALAQSYNLAHEVLSDPTKRRAYDLARAARAQPAEGDQTPAASEGPPPGRPDPGAEDSAQEHTEQPAPEDADEQPEREEAHEQPEGTDSQPTEQQHEREDSQPTAPERPDREADPLEVTIAPRTAREGGEVHFEAPCGACGGTGSPPQRGDAVCHWCGGSGSYHSRLAVPSGVANGAVVGPMLVIIGGGQQSRHVRFTIDPPPSGEPPLETTMPTRPVTPGGTAQAAAPSPNSGPSAAPHATSTTYRTGRGRTVLVLLAVLAVVGGGWALVRAQTDSSAEPAGPGPSVSATQDPSPPPAQAPVTSYERYANERFGFALDVPANWMSEPDSGDGVLLRSPDQSGELRAFGSNNVSGLSVTQALETSQQELLDAGSTLSFAAATDEYLTVSGYTADGEIFYERRWVGPGSINAVGWTYPKAQKEAYDDPVNHVVESFVPGDLNVAH